MELEGSEPSEYEAQSAYEEAAAALRPRGLHTASFKLLFAAQREPGRSYISAVKPLALPATVTGKFYTRKQTGDTEMDKAAEKAFEKIEKMFNHGPRERYNAPITSAQEVGWWWSTCLETTGRGDRRVRRALTDSAWMKERLRVLAADTRLKQR